MQPLQNRRYVAAPLSPSLQGFPQIEKISLVQNIFKTAKKPQNLLFYRITVTT
jgi:hypothetical protein